MATKTKKVFSDDTVRFDELKESIALIDTVKFPAKFLTRMVK